MSKRLLIVALMLTLAFALSCGGGKKSGTSGSLSSGITTGTPNSQGDADSGRPSPWDGERSIAEADEGFTRPEPAKTTSAISGPRFTPTSESIKQGLDYLIGVRGTFPFPELANATYPNVWEWYVGQGKAYMNIPGVVASGFLRAALSQGENADAYFAEGMKTVDDYIVVRYADPTSTATDRPYAHDVYSLYLAWQETGEASYIDLANVLAHRTMAAFTGAQYADRMITARYSMAGWDAAAYIYAFYLVGEGSGDQGIMDWAVAMADQMIYRWADWDHKVAGSSMWAWDWTMLSYGGMIKALTIVPDGNSIDYAGKVTYMRSEALAVQMNDGSFPVWYGAGPNAYAFDDVQATAYLLEALNIDDETETEASRSLAERYLRSIDIQKTDGSFIGYIGDAGVIYPEVCSEVLMALSSQTFAIEDYVGTVWTVDDDGLDFPGADFAHPQDAVNAASAGDTILVYPGTYGSRIAPPIKPPHWGNNDSYAPALIVYKDDLTIKAVSSDHDATIIESTHDWWSNPVAIQWSTGGTWDSGQKKYIGAGVNPIGGSAPNAISLIASRVTLDGFTMRKPNMGGGYWNTAGVMIGGLYAGDPYHLGSDGNTIINCYFRDVWHAVYIWHSSNNVILENTVAPLYGTGHWAAISTYDGYNDAQINLGHHSKGNHIVGNTIGNLGISIGAWDPPTWTDNEGTIVIGNTCTRVGSHYSLGNKLFSHNGAAGYWTANSSSVVVPLEVTYTSETFFVYESPIELSANLNFHFGFEPGQPGFPEDGSGFDVNFTIGGNTYPGITDSNGAVSVIVPAGLLVGTYNVEIEAFIWGDYTHTASATIEVVPIEGISYTGQLLWDSKTVTLQASLLYNPPEADASGKAVEFFIGNASVGFATTDSGGVASMSYTLADFGIFDIKCEFDDYEDTALLVAYDPTLASFVTGGGWIVGKLQSKADFGFSAKIESGTTTGTLSYSDGTYSFVEEPILWVVITDFTAYFGGTGWYAIAEDFGEPGKGKDSLSISIGSGYHNYGKLGGGNIKIHKKK